MADDMLLTTEPHAVRQEEEVEPVRGEGRGNEGNHHMGQNGGLSTFVNSEEMRVTAEAVLAENKQLRQQYAQAVACLASWQPRIAQIEKMKKYDMKLTEQNLMLHQKSKIKVASLEAEIASLKQQNQALKKQLNEPLGRGSPEGPGSQRGPVLDALRGHLRAVEQILQEELTVSRKQEDKEKGILETLMGHIEKAEEILASSDVRFGESLSAHGAAGSSPSEGKTSPTMERTPPSVRKGSTTPLSPTGQQAYNQSMENVLSQLQTLNKQVTESNAALNMERQRSESLEVQLKKARGEVDALKGAQESDVAAAMKRQREADDKKHQHEMGEMMAKLDELTLLAADKHQQHALDEEPRYHSASNELKQQVTSLVAELDHKERCLNEQKVQYQALVQVNEALQRKVNMYHEELTKARKEAQSYVDTIHNELKRKETMYQAERQKALHEKLQCDKCKEELGQAQARLTHLLKERNKYQEKEDRYLAEILSAEEAMEAKDIDKKKFEKEIVKLRNDVHIWKTQMEVCRVDFHEERKAREQMHTERLGLQAKMDELSRENKKMEEELQFFHRMQLQQGGGGGGSRYRSGSGYAGYDRGASAAFGNRTVYDVPGEDETGIMDVPFPYQPNYHQDLRQPQQVAAEVNWCPKCQQTFPDYDTLSIHLSECIE